MGLPSVDRKLALTSPTSDGWSVSIVHSHSHLTNLWDLWNAMYVCMQTKAMELLLLLLFLHSLQPASVAFFFGLVFHCDFRLSLSNMVLIPGDCTFQIISIL
jgi:hypothetical protein